MLRKKPRIARNRSVRTAYGADQNASGPRWSGTRAIRTHREANKPDALHGERHAFARRLRSSNQPCRFDLSGCTGKLPDRLPHGSVPVKDDGRFVREVAIESAQPGSPKTLTRIASLGLSMRETGGVSLEALDAIRASGGGVREGWTCRDKLFRTPILSQITARRRPARRSPGALRNRGFVMCRRSMRGGDDPHAENHISTFAAVACLARHCAMQKKPSYKKAPRGTNRPGLLKGQ